MVLVAARALLFSFFNVPAPTEIYTLSLHDALPIYSSGANALVSGVMKMLALYFGTDDVTFSVTSTNPNANPNSRTYARFTDAALDVVEARILQEIGRAHV